ncbi:MAG: phosphoglycerate dehydrogenase, partial [Thermomicrobiaceae bacterium]|nr:phosphoglycerate dehydrogenase [Thermomicrobiaceae bacterium]
MGDKALPRVLVCEPLHQDALDLLAANARVDVRTGLSRDELLDIVDAYDALVVRSKTQVSGDVIEAGINLRVIARAGIGVDNIDVDAATEHGIAVVNAAGASAQSVAELTLGLILALLRHIPTADRTMKAGQWEKSRL